MQLLSKQVAIITGAAHALGMGFQSAKVLAKQGATVILTDRVADEATRQALEERKQELLAQGFEADFHPLDVTDSVQIRECVDYVIAQFGRIDILFNNAGSPAGVGPFLEQTAKQWQLSLSVNVTGVVELCQAVIPHMLKQKKGSIINNASLAGLGSLPHLAGYCASKAALVSLTKTMACEFGEQGIRVNAICPGNIWTQMSELEVDIYVQQGQDASEVKQQMVDAVPMKRWGSAEEIGDCVAYLASDMASYVNGAVIPVSGGLAPGL